MYIVNNKQWWLTALVSAVVNSSRIHFNCKYLKYTEKPIMWSGKYELWMLQCDVILDFLQYRKKL